MRLYVIRHGQSVNNLNMIWSGWFDAPLTDKGRADALKAAEVIKGIKPDKVYASDLCRAIETAKIAVPGCTPITTPLLREVNVGSIASTPIANTTPEMRARIKEEGYTFLGGESKEEFKQRIANFMSLMEKEECDTVFAFCHGGWLRGMLGLVLSAEITKANVSCDNCAVGVFDFNGRWSLHSWINH